MQDFINFVEIIAPKLFVALPIELHPDHMNRMAGLEPATHKSQQARRKVLLSHMVGVMYRACLTQRKRVCIPIARVKL